MKNPLDILDKEGVKVQSLTISDQHATLLITQQVVIAKDPDIIKLMIIMILIMMVKLRRIQLLSLHYSS